MIRGITGIVAQPDTEEATDSEHRTVLRRRGQRAGAALAAGALVMEASQSAAAFTLQGDTMNIGTALSATGHQASECRVTSDRLLFFFDGTDWRRVPFSPLPSHAPASPPAPRPRSR
jgi:hypothetical protein